MHMHTSPCPFRRVAFPLLFHSPPLPAIPFLPLGNANFPLPLLHCVASSCMPAAANFLLRTSFPSSTIFLPPTDILPAPCKHPTSTTTIVRHIRHAHLHEERALLMHARRVISTPCCSRDKARARDKRITARRTHTETRTTDTHRHTATLAPS